MAWTQRPGGRATPKEESPSNRPLNQPQEESGKKKRQVQRIGRIAGDIAIAKNYRIWPNIGGHFGGKMGWEYIGRKDLTLDRVIICSCGKVQIGLQTYHLGVAVGRRNFYLGSQGRLWKVPGALLHEPATNLRALKRDDRIKLAQMCDAYKRAFCALAQPKIERELTDEMTKRYRELTFNLVHERMMRCAATGLPKDPIDFAKGISTSWGEQELLKPACPSLMHALMVSLVLGLDDKSARNLIMLGCMSEFRVPILTEETASLVFRQASQLLGTACPEWWDRGFLTDWKAQGSIERIFEGQWAMMLRSSWGRGSLPTEAVRYSEVPVYPAESQVYVEDEEEDEEEEEEEG